MSKRILVLGASGTVGSMVFKYLTYHDEWKITGTYCSSCSSEMEDSSVWLYFSLEKPDDIYAILERVRPDVVVSALRGNFERQLLVHGMIADELAVRHGKMIYVSTVNVFDGNFAAPHYEKDDRISDSDYGQFKIRCEDLLQARLGDQAVLLRIPFVWGKNSPRIQNLAEGCKNGSLEMYTGLLSNHVSDLQIAEYIEWIIREDKRGIFHIGTTDIIAYEDFVEQLITALGMKRPKFISCQVAGTMAVLSARNDVPDRLKWNISKLLEYICNIQKGLGVSN